MLDRRLKSQPFSQFWRIGLLNYESPIARFESQFKSQGILGHESRVFKSLAILDLDRAISPI